MPANPAYVKKLIRIAANEGLLISEQGRVNPTLAMKASVISLLQNFWVAERDGRIMDQDI